MAKNRRLALMIDGDNAQAALLPRILTEVAKYGEAPIRRVYGDWASPYLKSWNELVPNYALKQVQQFSYVNGKNTTDIALIIDTMEIIHTAGVDGVCIISSDSDYTPLATHIREKGLFVMGIGRHNTSPAFVAACEVFLFTDDLTTSPEKTTPASATQSIQPPAPATSSNGKLDVQQLMKSAFHSETPNGGWVHLSALGDRLRKLDPNFDPGKHGHKTLLQLVEAHPRLFTIKKQSTVVYIRLARP